MSRYLGTRVMFHRPLEVLRWPPMMICPSFVISTWYLVNIETQSSSHSCPMEIRDPELMLSKMCLSCASWGSLVERGVVPRVEGSSLEPFDTCTEGPIDVGWMAVQYCLAEGNI